MLESTMLLISELRRAFRLVDAIDIVLVAVFIYALLIWLRRTASRGMASGVVAFAIIYFLSRSLDMYLTSMVFHAAFAALLFILVVVFQEDLRRLFERVSTLHRVGFQRGRPGRVNIDQLADTVFTMSGTKTGAIIVLEGKESLDRHYDGGIELGGKLSKPIILSIFNSDAPGHDGAVIIEKDRIDRFAVHLPISKNIVEIAGRGTRHSAALGISECSDAIAIVVSEERGAVSVGESGRLTEIPSAPALKKRLENYCSLTFPSTQGSFTERFITQHAGAKFLAITISVIAWFVLAYDPHTVQRTFVVPIEYRSVPQALLLDEGVPTESRVTLSGSERDFRFLEPSSLKVTLDLAGKKAGAHEFTVTEHNIQIPANLSPYRIEPKLVPLTLRKPAPIQRAN
ncbi:MAG: diadenylate cyclase [Pirellulaceae bacterium]|jgi:diadenylate cyclase